MYKIVKLGGKYVILPRVYSLAGMPDQLKGMHKTREEAQAILKLIKQG